MKSITISMNFIKKNSIPIVITVLILTVSMFILVTYIGQYNYASYAKDVLEASLPDGVYYMDMSDDFYDASESTGETKAALKANLADFPAFSHAVDCEHTAIGGAGDAFYNVFLFDHAMRSAFRLEVEEGRWLSDFPTETEAVVGGVYAGDTKVGDTLTLEGGVTAKVVGLFGDAAIYPSFDSGGTTVSAESLFSVNDTVVILTSETLPEGAIDTSSSFPSPNFYIAFDKKASDSERRELIAFLEETGTVETYDGIIANSEAELAEWVVTALPLPLFLIIISTVNIICIATVIVKKSMADLSKYYLIGCTKRRGAMLITAPMALIFSLPCVFNLLSIALSPNFLRAGGRTSMIDYIFDFGTSALVGAYFLLLLVILAVLPTVFFRKFSPISFYKKNI